jgi:hypothetical protein
MEAKPEGSEAAGAAAESQGGQGGQGGEQHPKGGAQGEQPGNPKSEAEELRAQLSQLQGDLANFKRVEEERKTKEKKHQEELLKEQGKFKDLYDTEHGELEAARARLTKQDEAFKAMLDEELKALPTDFNKELIPAGDPHTQLLWLRKAKPMFSPRSDGGRRGDGAPPPAGAGPLATMASIYSHPTSPKH